ncbi:hypothetical protein BD410DRAFT_806061 [Rickenella mellea]|uniref:DUF6534 domain-containing protein n=1 Tax=Rickenella mellea TaxID=50990 RepID=A0A4Y7PW33_9AGAM|nr:hypothetical protein BD410DRAFT_806061 [Rickenella mellea]
MTVADTFGAAFVGLVASAVLYGLTVLQTTYHHDSKGMKWFCIYWYLVARFGDHPNLGIPHWSMDLQTDANAIVGVGVQMFFARRVWQISRQKLLTTIIVILSAMHGSLVYSIFATLTVIFYAVMPNNSVWVSFFWSLGRLYINSFLATLNSREMLREAVLPIDGSLVQLSQIRSTGSKAYRYPTDPKKASPSPNVTVETSKEKCADYLPSPMRGDIEAQSPSSAKDLLEPDSPNVYAHLSFHQSPLAYQNDPFTPSYKR